MLLLGKWEVMNLCVRGIGFFSFYDFGTVLTVCVYFVHFIYINKTLLIQILDSKYLIYWRLTYSNHVMYTWGDMFSTKTKKYNETNNNNKQTTKIVSIQSKFITWLLKEDILFRHVSHDLYFDLIARKTMNQQSQTLLWSNTSTAIPTTHKVTFLSSYFSLEICKT